MNKAEEFHKKVLRELETYTTKKVDRFFKHLLSGDDRDQEYFKSIYRKRVEPCLFYQYLACAVRVLGVNQAIEFGADRGASALMMASEMPKGMVYSFDVRNGWEFIPDDIKNITKLNRSSLDVDAALLDEINIYEKSLWLIDGSHYPEHVRQEIELWSPYWVDGTVVIFDDLMAIEPSFSNMPYENKIRNFAEIQGPDETVGVGVLVV